MKVKKSFKSYILKKRLMEEDKIQAEKRKEAKKALHQAEIFVPDRCDNEDYLNLLPEFKKLIEDIEKRSK